MEDKNYSFGSAQDLLDIQSMMSMRDLPEALNMHKHKNGCAYKESVRFLCGSLELNVRRQLPVPTAEGDRSAGFVNAPVQVATPILECTCDTLTKVIGPVRLFKSLWPFGGKKW